MFPLPRSQHEFPTQEGSFISKKNVAQMAAFHTALGGNTESNQLPLATTSPQTHRFAKAES